MASELDGFYTTWSQARDTYGQGTPVTGERFDSSSTLNGLKSQLDAAAPGDRWSGAASESYGDANSRQQQILAHVAELDQKLSGQVTNAANIVSTGRTNLDELRKWVTDAAATTTDDQAGRTMKMQIARQGLAQLTEIMNGTHGEIQTVKGNIDKLTGEYDGVKNEIQFLSGEDKDGDGKPDDEDGDGTPDEEESPADQGREDSEALQNGTLTDEQRERIEANTTLSDEQKAALDNGSATMPPDQMAYLQNFSREFGDKTPAEIEEIMNRNGETGNRVADAFQLASNPNITTGLPPTDPPSFDQPASGGKHALPEGIQKVLDGPVMYQPFTEDIRDNDGNVIFRGEPNGPLQVSPGLNDLADIMQKGDSSLQKGTDLDSGMMAKSQELLVKANEFPNQLPAIGTTPIEDGVRWHHENTDPTLQNMLNSINKDDIVINDAVTGPGSEQFLDNLTKHQWQDDGLAAGGLFDWVAEDAQNDPTGRAASTAHALANYTAANQNDLLNIPGAGTASLGEVNPELTRDMSRAFAPYLDDMVGYNLDGTNAGVFNGFEDGDQALKTRALMSVMYTDDQASEIIYQAAGADIEGYVTNAAGSLVDGDPTSDNSAMLAAGKLQSALDLSSFDEKYDESRNAAQAVQDSYDRRSRLFDTVSGIAGLTPGAGTGIGLVSPYMKDMFIGPPPDGATTPTAAPRSDFPLQVKMAEALLQSPVGDPQIRQWLQDQLGDQPQFDVPPPQDRGRNEFYNNITSYFEDIRGGNSMLEQYWKSYTNPYLNAQPRIDGE